MVRPHLNLFIVPIRHTTGSQLTNHSTISVTTRYVIIYEDHALIILLLLI